MNIYLCGFMGSGKTTLFKRLQRESGKEGFDFDQEIAKRAGVSSDKLGDYIEEIGWEKFRSLELNLFKDTLENYNDGLFALGGGTVMSPEVQKLIGNNVCNVYWLGTPVEECWERVKNETHRPLVKHGKEAFFQLFNDRLNIYQNYKEVDESFSI